MKVILLQDVPGTGKRNQVLTVSDGFARNYLLPRKWAVEASDSAVHEIERKNQVEREKEQERRSNAQAQADELKGKLVTLAAKAGDKGRLYGSITVQEVAEALEKQLGVAVEKRKIELGESIRNIGEYEMTVSLYTGIKAAMRLKIVPLS